MNSSKWIIAVLNISKVFEVNTNQNLKTRITGIEGCFADAIFTKMNIEYDIVFTLDNEFGHEITAGNWTGLVGLVQRGEADLAICTLGINENRFKVIDFSFPYASSRLTFAALKPSEWSRTCLLNLVDLPTWMLLLSSILLSTAMAFDVLKATPTKVAPIKNFRELFKAVERGTHRAFSVKGTIAVPFFMNSKEPYLQILGRLMEQNNWYIPPGEACNIQEKGEESIMIGLVNIYCSSLELSYFNLEF
ncbi:glutamate receptor ionotropic, delta-1 [Trichonephila clavipes]|nr:glutamate receptor ionotropic, delta-1 [Trichonephila clavipes]